MKSVSFGNNNAGLQIGDHRGTINVEFLLPPERPKTPPGPTSTVPFRRDPDFVCRGKLLDQIDKKTSAPGSRMALVGLGGVGKSLLAIEYSFRIRSQSPSTWVFWVHASNETRFEQSFRAIADMAQITGRQDPTANIFSLVEQWLWNEKNGKWLMILDNVDDYEPLGKLLDRGPTCLRNTQPNARVKPLLDYVPRSHNGTIIITSRTKEVALNLVDNEDMIEVEPMDKPEALELLQRKLRTTKEITESRQLVEELNFMPLAIVQAASYIRNRAPRYSVSQYLIDFQSSDRGAIKLLQKEASSLSRDWEAKNSIVMTWQISFEHIRQTKPSAADLLSLMSFFDRQGIPVNLIRNHPESSSSSTLKLSDNSDDEETSRFDIGLDFEDDVLMLRDYSFISLNKTTETLFTMHRLVQLTTHAWLKSHDRIDQWQEKFINILYREFPTGQYENWRICCSLFPHVRSAITQKPKTREILLKWATLLYRGAWYASESGNIAD
ncbi:hypothetical protein PENCOP_c022G04567, partial [Penicillium coprophilum]